MYNVGISVMSYNSATTKQQKKLIKNDFVNKEVEAMKNIIGMKRVLM